MAELIVALDVPTPQAVRPILGQLEDSVTFYKIGLELFCAGGERVVRDVVSADKRVFLDLKLHDIPRTVANSIRTAWQPGVELMTIHAAGGPAMISAAAEAAAEINREAGISRSPNRLKILAVTVLTSLAPEDLHKIGVPATPAEQVLKLAKLAIQSGADGVVCSPQEVASLRASLPLGTTLVTPGIRPAGGEVADQKRIATPAAAVKSGATHLVVGRPILQAENPADAARAILGEMNNA